MKKTIITSIVAAAFGLMTTSCDDFMAPESPSYIYDSDSSLSDPRDSIYSSIGLLSKIQQLGERYVLFGELRGDLMEASENADLALQQLASFEPQTDDIFLRRTDFYGVINHCNWIIAKMNPETVVGSDRVFAEEYAAAVIYRAWTYLQLGLAYGSVDWITEPVLTLEGSEATYEHVEFDELVRRLIAEVEPYAAFKRPDFGNLDNRPASNFYLVPAMLLGDLYLYDGRYDNAAQMYWQTITDYNLRIEDNVVSFRDNKRNSLGSLSGTGNYVTESFSAIPYSSSANAFHTNLVNMCVSEKPVLRPSMAWVERSADKSYFLGSKVYVSQTFETLEAGGDLRVAVRYADGSWRRGGAVAPYSVTMGEGQQMMIDKFVSNSQMFDGSTTENVVLGQARGLTQISLANAAQAYLRYAEAVNRLGKPTLAYAVVRYGLKAETLADSTKVNPAELESGEPWLAWGESFLDSNVGTAVRGRGYGFAYPEATENDLPTTLTEAETIDYVEEILADEMAAETSFEGSRFFDLMRIAHHRADNAWFADRVASRFGNSADVRAKLLDRANWFIR